MIKIHSLNTGETHEVPISCTLAEIATLLNIKLANPILGATVNNKFVGLGYRVYQPKNILFFDITHPEGYRTYTRSLTLMLLAAAEEVAPDAQLHVLHSVSGGLYCELRRDNKNISSPELIAKLLARMREMTTKALPIVRREVETAEAIEMLKTQPNKIRLIKQHGEIYTTIHSLDGHNSVMYGDLVPNTSYINVYDLCPFLNGMMLSLPCSNEPSKTEPLVDQKKMFAVFQDFDDRLKKFQTENIADLNDLITAGQGHRIIQVMETMQEKNIGYIADAIADRDFEIKVVLISGPSSSGKTTFSKRLALHLVVNGIKPVNLSVDNYFVNREDTPRDENGDYDFEALEAVDVKFFNEQLVALSKGEEVEIPKFNFKTGQRYFDGEKLRMEAGSVLVIEGIHALSPKLTEALPDNLKFRIYICPLASINLDNTARISTTDNRLIRRIVRDYAQRGYSAEDTILRWPSVRRGESKYIYPNQEQADHMFNTAMIYELAALKAIAEPILLEVAPNSPAYGEARRLIKFLSYFKPLDTTTVPPTSIIREFLGGSSFQYD